MLANVVGAPSHRPTIVIVASLPGSVVGVFAADTLAQRAISRPSGPLRVTAAPPPVACGLGEYARRIWLWLFGARPHGPRILEVATLTVDGMSFAVLRWSYMRSPERPPIVDVELSQPALTLANRFVQRWDLYAKQLNDGRYLCIHEGLNVNHLFAHLRGEITLGTYLLNKESQARFIVLDADDPESWQRLSYAAQELAQADIPGYLEHSRRGGHLWLFLPDWVPGEEARAFGLGVIARHHLEDIELFPKQDALGDGPGSLIRMSFGVHRLTGCRYGFRHADDRFIAPTVRDQLRVLATPQTVPKDAFDLYRTSIPLEPDPPVSEALVTAETLSDRIKTGISVMDFVGQYVELTPTKSGAIGLCPFHDDHHPSFGVNAEGNYWHCFAGCGGGSVIDFWMKWRRCGFPEAVRELAGGA